MKIKFNLVFDKGIGELIGYVDFGDFEVNYLILDKIDEVVSYVMVFFVRGVCIELKFSFVYFVIDGVIFG